MGITDKILAYIAGGAAAVLAVALGVMWLVDSYKISDITSQRDKAQSALATEQENYATIKGGISSINAGIAALKAEGDKATAAANQALEVARAANEKLLKSAADMLKAKPGQDKCVSARLLGMDVTQ